MKKGFLASGMTTCAGCAMELIARIVFDAMGENTVLAIPPGCAAILAGYNGETPLELPVVMSNLEATASFASGIRAGLDILGKSHIGVLGFAGDGGTADIGLQSLSGAAERNERIVYICYDNEAYMNTGIQGSGSTPLGAWTTTTPAGKGSSRKDLAGIMAAHGIPYVATASVAYLDDLAAKVHKAKRAEGTSFIHVHSPCPTGWRFHPSKTIEVAKMAVRTGMWLLYEVEQGVTKINVKVKSLLPVQHYLSMQGRFNQLTSEDISVIQEQIHSQRKAVYSRSHGGLTESKRINYKSGGDADAD